jgi:hypothetical protein
VAAAWLGGEGLHVAAEAFRIGLLLQRADEGRQRLGEHAHHRSE